MQQLADQIVNILTDYHNYDGFQITSERVITWVDQFEEPDRLFILEEFLHLLCQGIYISENQGKDLLVKRIQRLAKFYKFDSVGSFLSNVEFLRIQKKGKSQEALLNLLNVELITKFEIGLDDCGTNTKRYFIYVDDILATGGTVFNDLQGWLMIKDNEGLNLDKVVRKDVNLIVSLFCRHNWANVDWRLRLSLDRPLIVNKIFYIADHAIENNPNGFSQKLNFAYPVQNQDTFVTDYFNTLSASNHGDQAFRKTGTPVVETLFSTPGNRIRFENIILKKGIQLLQNTETLQANHRPLGATFPSYKTFGTGTLFFTWRNISNTCPIVFWWGAGGWLPLFPLKGRGQAKI